MFELRLGQDSLRLRINLLKRFEVTRSHLKCERVVEEIYF